MDEEQLIVVAGEYVLGTLDPAEREAFVRRMADDPAAAQAVTEWRMRLGPLGTAAREVPPPAHLWPAIEERIGLIEPVVPAEILAVNDNRVSPWWRSGAVAASLAALVLAGVAFTPGRHAVPDAAPPIAAASAEMPTYVSAVTREGAEPALLITLDPETGKAVVRAIGLTPPQKKSLELWYIGGGRAPKSMGLVEGDMEKAMMLGDAMRNRDKLDDSMFAISVEPEGGAPAGKPTGTIMYTGKVRQVSGT
ncbi:Anti-sigma-K factor RskA [Sphingomonas laterariae]|uniref:Regulator of SigK n=1 Tax=Edaphosphingomonas laterariae TaxID=861865 RepID=A0A239DXE9_9SPHN|nr:anti-sigma factor [Sphingomonas laterariae]SNS36304.1 Anti-sigma-K factor RskA [Sphingomonas laterariae]